MNKFCVFAMLVFSSACFAIQPAIADTYKIVAVSSDNGYNLYSFDGVHFVLSALYGEPGPTYYAYEFGDFIGSSQTPPAFDTPPPNLFPAGGAGCLDGVPAGTVIVKSVCQNGRYAFEGFLPGVDPSSGHPTLFVDTGQGLTMLSGMDTGLHLLMGLGGDIIWDDQVSENWFEAVDTTTAPVPEPTSLLLLGTGVLFAIRQTRRRA
jgi:PEP-CTERM motif